MPVFPTVFVKATRKEQHCFGCCDVIPVGSRVQKSAGTTDGDFWTMTVCAACADWLKIHGGEFWGAYPDGCDDGTIGEARRATPNPEVPTGTATQAPEREKGQADAT